MSLELDFSRPLGQQTHIIDVFSDTPDADPAEIVVKGPKRPVKYVDPLGNSGEKKKRANFDPHQQNWFRKQGWTFQRTEYRGTDGRTHDLWTFGDYLVLDHQPGSLIVQTTSKNQVTTRLKKAEETPELPVWLAHGNRFEVHGWSKDEARNRWVVKRIAVVLIDGTLTRKEI